MEIEHCEKDDLYLFADEPFPPGQPKCVDRDRTHIKMKWEPPENDGGNPVKSYDVERKEPKTNRWAKINKEPITVSGLNDLLINE